MKEVIRDRQRRRLSAPKRIGCSYRLTAFSSVPGFDPAHSDFVAAPKVPRDGKTVGLSPHDCRHLLDAPNVETGTQLVCAVKRCLVFSGCNSHPATGSLQPVAIGAAVEVTKPSEPSRQMCRSGDAASRQAVTRVNVEQASKRPMWSPTSH